MPITPWWNPANPMPGMPPITGTRAAMPGGAAALAGAPANPTMAPPSAFTAQVSPQQAALYRQPSTPEGYAAALRGLANAPAPANAIAGVAPPVTPPGEFGPLPGLPGTGLPNPTQGAAWGAGQSYAAAPLSAPLGMPGILPEAWNWQTRYGP
jgi:hypothetical protein